MTKYKTWKEYVDARDLKKKEFESTSDLKERKAIIKEMWRMMREDAPEVNMRIMP
jgi:hypothetical protein